MDTLRLDLDFLTFARDPIHRRHPIDADAQALIGHSDGASYALSVGLSNPHGFSAVLDWAAGFEVAFLADQNGQRWPRADFHRDALDWLFTGELPE